jgi:hypothetical protein
MGGSLTRPAGSGPALSGAEGARLRTGYLPAKMMDESVLAGSTFIITKF